MAWIREWRRRSLSTFNLRRCEVFMQYILVVFRTFYILSCDIFRVVLPQWLTVVFFARNKYNQIKIERLLILSSQIMIMKYVVLSYLLSTVCGLHTCICFGLIFWRFFLAAKDETVMSLCILLGTVHKWRHPKSAQKWYVSLLIKHESCLSVCSNLFSESTRLAKALFGPAWVMKKSDFWIFHFYGF